MNMFLELRVGFYPMLAEVANRWLEQVGHQSDLI
jgi:hypothetical protein